MNMIPTVAHSNAESAASAALR
eukprot:COSAG02_NODE_50702_length_319_cov_0.381818_1_plen_21_part_10